MSNNAGPQILKEKNTHQGELHILPGFFSGTLYKPQFREIEPRLNVVALLRWKNQRLEPRAALTAGVCGTKEQRKEAAEKKSRYYLRNTPWVLG